MLYNHSNNHKKEDSIENILRKAYDEHCFLCGPCDNRKYCIMAAYIYEMIEGKLVSDIKDNPKRKEIINGLVSLSIEFNRKISDLYKKINNNGIFPKTPPLFGLKVLHCLERKN